MVQSHFVYATDGASPDALNVYDASRGQLTLMQRVPVGRGSSVEFGVHLVAIARSTPARPACLVYASSSEGSVYSFAIQSSGLLSGPIDTAYVGGYPRDVAVEGDFVYVASMGIAPNAIDVLRLDAQCAMRLMQRNSVAAEFDGSIAALPGYRVASVDEIAGDLVIYQQNRDGELKKVIDTPGQLPQVPMGGPHSVAMWNAKTPVGVVTNIYTGDAVPGVPQVQGFQLSKGNLTSLEGSPSADLDEGAQNGAAIVLDAKHSLLIQANARSGQLGWYHVTLGTPTVPGSIAFAGDTTLSATFGEPGTFALLGDFLLVGTTHGVIEGCKVSSDGVSACTYLAQPNVYGAGTSLAVL
jgi:hypothetical protein